jgi:hypothetical protein
MESMEMAKIAPGALPRPGKVPEQRLLSPKIGLRWWWHCGTLLGETPIHLGFSRQRHFIGRRVMSTHASVLVDSVGPPSAEVCRAAASFP